MGGGKKHHSSSSSSGSSSSSSDSSGTGDGHDDRSVDSSRMGMADARRRAKWFVMDTHSAAKGTDNDGINTIGRVGIILATASLVMFLLSLINPTWAVVDNISTGGKFLDAHPYFNKVESVKFGFYSFCMETKVKNLNYASHDVCFYRYSKEMFMLKGNIPDGETCSSLRKGACANDHCTCEEPSDAYPEGVVTSKEMTGFDHFEFFKLKAKRENIEWVVLGVLIVMVLADIFSNVLALNAMGCILGSGGGVASMVLWGRFKKALDDGVEGDVDQGWGFIFLCLGFSLAFAGGVFSILDLVCYPRSERFGVANDGVNYVGRWGGMLMGALVWMCLAASLTFPQWAVTDNIEDGKHGFKHTGLQGAYGATFGLMGYCLEMDVDAFVDPQFVCMDMADEVQMSSMPEKYFNEDGTIPSRNGCEIFEDVDYCKRCEFVIYMVLFMISMTLIGDVFSEKLFTNSMIMFFNTVGAGLTSIQWLIFKIHISGPKPYASAGKVDVGEGFYLCLMAAGCALISCISFYLDFKDLCDCCAHNDFAEGKSKKDNPDECTCFLLHGSGTSGYDGQNVTKDGVTKVTKRNRDHRNDSHA